MLMAATLERWKVLVIYESVVPKCPRISLASSSDKRHRCFATVKILHLDVAIWNETKCKIEAISPMWEVASSNCRGSGGVAIVVPRQREDERNESE